MSMLVMAGGVGSSSSGGVVLASVFDTVTATSMDAQDAMVTVAAAVAVFYILRKAIQSGMALTAIVVGLVTAGLLLWGVSNTSWFQKQVGDSFTEPGTQNAVGVRVPGGAPAAARPEVSGATGVIGVMGV